MSKRISSRTIVSKQRFVSSTRPKPLSRSWQKIRSSGAPAASRELTSRAYGDGRIKGFENHLIFYRPSEDGVDIIRVLHGARDIEKVFEEDEDL